MPDQEDNLPPELHHPPDTDQHVPPQASPTSAPAGFFLGVADCSLVFVLIIIATVVGGYLGFQPKPKNGHDDGFGILAQLIGAAMGALFGAVGGATVGLCVLFASAWWAKDAAK
jgi:hypothetical protein